MPLIHLSVIGNNKDTLTSAEHEVQAPAGQIFHFFFNLFIYFFLIEIFAVIFGF